MGVLEMVRQGGIWVYLIFALSLFANTVSGLGLVAAVFAKPKYKMWFKVGGVICGILALTILSIGALGYWMGMSEMRNAMDVVDPAFRQDMMTRGEEIAWIAPKFAGVGAVFPALTMVGLWLKASMMSED